jgi:transposase
VAVLLFVPLTGPSEASTRDVNNHVHRLATHEPFESFFGTLETELLAREHFDTLKHSGDETDARYLAHLLRLGILATGTILPPEARAVRDLARKRMQLVRSCTSHILAVENITARQFGARLTSRQVSRLDPETIDQMHLPDDVAFAVRANGAVIATLCAQIEIVEKRLQEKVKPHPDYALLTTVPGIGPILASVILLETGSIERFVSAGNFASYARCVDS